ncbi:MAG: mobile mystery protein B [Phycisphaerae bacterium]|jgi:Fic-DOC domain mobile mystery protein B
MNVEAGDPHCTVHDRSGLKLKGRVTDAAINAAELEACATTTMKYYGKRPTSKTAPFNSRWMFKLHGEMFGKVWTWAGQARTSDSNIGIAWRQINVQVEMLAQDVAVWPKESLESAVRLHLRAVQIHPFTDGNGRWARLLSNIWLLQNKLHEVRWPDPLLRDTSSPIRKEYIDAIKSADNGDSNALVALHKRFQCVRG